MGTYGTTWIKKGNKKIDLTDSHDGYFYGMGLNNLISIKYISDEAMNKLVDAFTPLDYSFEGNKSITERQIKDAFYDMEQDLQGNQEGLDWAKNCFFDNVRASVTGFGPILYLNINPSFTYSSEPDYIIDLDKKEFVSVNHAAAFKLSFDTIRNIPKKMLYYFSQSFLNKEKLQNLLEDYYELKSKEYKKEITEEEKEKLQTLEIKMQKEVDEFFNVSQVEMYKKQAEEIEKQRKAYLEALDKRQAPQNKNINDERNGFSVFSVNKMPISEFRKVISYVQKYIKLNPEAKFLEELIEWGVSPDGMSVGLRMMSPVKMSQEYIFRIFEQTIEREFKLSMNIFSSSEDHPSLIEEGKKVEEEQSSFFGNVPKIQKSLFGLDEFVNLNASWINGVADADPGLAYYVYYDEARNVVLSNKLAHENYSVVWLYNALINQDTEVFNKVISQATEVYASLTSNVKEKVAESFLKSIADGQQVNSLLGLENNLDFTNVLKNSSLLEEIKPFMSKREIATYFPSEVKKMKK